jgi:hypothetical protein
MNVELIYERTCPNVEAARTRLMQAFHRACIPAKWREWEVSRPETPEYARQYGSPTILVNGNDVSGGDNQASSNSCRLYTTGNGYEPVPAEEQIAGALRQAAGDAATPYKSRSLSFTALPSVGVALLPKLTCPICWPAYTALLSSAGINFVNYTPYLLPTVGLLLAITLWALVYRARARHGYGPLWLGLLGSLSVLIGKFILESDPALFLGSGLLVGASLWNIWPRKFRKTTTPISA